jgi:uncharacterized membrane protein YoaK (UPF0700 family)
VSPSATKSAVALLLSFAAGFVDIVGFLVLLHTFTAHMTGVTVHAASDFVLRNLPSAFLGIQVLATFFAGSVVGRTIIEAAARSRIQRAASITLTLEAVILAAVAIGSPTHFQQVRVLAMAGAMGLQTATLTRIGPLTVHTTFVTGMINKLSQLVAHALALTYDTVIRRRPVHHHRRRAYRQAAFIFSIWLLYFAGATAGAGLAVTASLHALLVPVAILMFTVIADQVQPFSLQEEQDEVDQAA